MRKIVFAKNAYYKFRQTFKLVFATMLIIAFLKLFILDFFWIPSVSMQPTLLKGDHVIALKVVYGFVFKLLPERGDIVVAKLPNDPSYYVKRVVALPDEKVDMRSGDLFVNDRKATKTYDADVSNYRYIDGDHVVLREYVEDPSPRALRSGATGGKRSYCIMQSNIQRIPDFVEPYTNGPDSVFLLGDNRSNSVDSRNWGSVDKKRIIGRVVFVWLSIDPNTRKIRWDRMGFVR